MDARQHVISVTIAPTTDCDEEKLALGLRRLMDEDPSFLMSRDVRTGQTIIHGMDELQLGTIIERLRHEFNIEGTFGKPRVAYRESITHPAEGVGRFVKQISRIALYAHVELQVEPLPRGTGFEFVNKIVVGEIPKEYFKAIEAGIVEAMEGGVLAGYEMVDIRAILTSGRYHDVDSSELAFKIAASMGFKEAARKAQPILLEPVMSVEVVVPEQYMGDVIGDLSGRRGEIQGMEVRASSQIIRAHVPLAEMFGYSSELRSRTQGRATYAMHFVRYDPRPGDPPNQDEGRTSPVALPRTPAPRGKESGVALPEPE